LFYTVPVTEKLPDFGRITALYERAFPANERRPLHPLLNDTTGCSDFLAFYEDKEFVGFACLLTRRDITHILYIAIDEAMRGQGYGTKALEAIRRVRPGQRIIADLEDDAREAEGGPRHKRKQFYERCGYRKTGVEYPWRGEDYIILSQGGPVTMEEFLSFWHYFEHENTAFSEF